MNKLARSDQFIVAAFKDKSLEILFLIRKLHSKSSLNSNYVTTIVSMGNLPYRITRSIDNTVIKWNLARKNKFAATLDMLVM